MADASVSEVAGFPGVSLNARSRVSTLATVSPLLVILLLGAVIRLTLWLCFQHVPIGIDDERDYNHLAKILVEHGEFSFTPGTLTSLRPPLYPALVASTYALFGIENYQAVRLVQALLSLLNVVVLYGLGREIASRRTALWLAALFCFYPSLIGFNNLLLTETLFTLLLSTFCYQIILAYTRESLWYLLFAGVTLGLATLTRSIMWMFPPLLILFLLATWKASWLRRCLAVIAVLTPFVITLAPWSVRNTVLQETFVPVDVMGGRNFLMGNYEYTPLYRAWDAIAYTDERAWYQQLGAYPLEQRSTQGKLDKVALKEGLKFVYQHPLLTLQRDIIKFFDFWGLERELIAGAGHDRFGPLSGIAMMFLTTIIIGSYVGALFLGIFGLCLVPLTERCLSFFLSLVVAYVCGIHTLVFAHSRYHLPVIPFVLVFAASAITSRSMLWPQRKSAMFWLAVALCGLMVFGWMWGMAAGDLSKIREAIFSFV